MDNTKKVKLIKRLNAVDSIGEVIFTETEKTVFAKITSSSQSEWFTAHRDGINSAYRLEIYSFEYDGETVCEVDGVRYGIYRTFEKSRDRIELYLEEKAGLEDV